MFALGNSTVMPDRTIYIARVIMLVILWFIVCGFTVHPTDTELITYGLVILIDSYLDKPIAAKDLS